MSYSADYWIEKLGLQPHPEGGFFREVYRSAEKLKQSALPGRFGGDRSFATSIYFLMPAGKISALHRIASDEGWHFYAGSTLAVYTISPEGKLNTILLGPDPGSGEVFQVVVPHGHWFGSALQGNEGYALVGCTVAPGFDFADFEMAKRDELLKQFPQHRDIIEKLTYS